MTGSKHDLPPDSVIAQVPAWLDPQPDLPRWRMFGNQSSNLSSEIYSMQMQLCRLALGDLENEKKLILRDCYRLLKLCAKAMRNPFRSALFKYQTLQTISQELILVDTDASLHSSWTTVQKRTLALDAREQDIVGKLPAFSVAKSYFEPADPSANGTPIPINVRVALRDLKKYLDEKIALQVWKSTSMKWRSNIHMSMTAILSVAVGFHLTEIPMSGAQSVDLSREPLWLMAVGALGATISSIARPSPPEIPLSTKNSLLRPVLGAIAGLFFYLIAESGGLRPTNPVILYLFALAFGFSDEILVKLLDESGRRAGAEATRALGHPSRDRS